MCRRVVELEVVGCMEQFPQRPETWANQKIPKLGSFWTASRCTRHREEHSEEQQWNLETEESDRRGNMDRCVQQTDREKCVSA